MKPRQKYIRLSQGPILVRPEQKKLVDGYCKHRSMTINQATRNLIDFGLERGFFVPPTTTSGTMPAVESDQ